MPFYSFKCPFFVFSRHCPMILNYSLYITISIPVTHTQNAKASATLKLVNEPLSKLKVKLVKTYSIYIYISKKHLSNHGLHLNQPWKVRPAMNFIFYVNKMWRCEWNSANTDLGIIDNLSNDEHFPSPGESKHNSYLDIEGLISFEKQHSFNPGLQISIGHRTMTDRNKCLTDKTIWVSHCVWEKNKNIDEVFI